MILENNLTGCHRNQIVSFSIKNFRLIEIEKTRNAITTLSKQKTGDIEFAPVFLFSVNLILLSYLNPSLFTMTL